MMKKSRFQKGQIAFEFLTIYGVFLLLFLAVLTIINQFAADQYNAAENMYARELTVRFVDEINTASHFPGYQKSFTFPSKFRDLPYNITVANATFILDYIRGQEITIIHSLLTSNVVLPSGGIDTSKGYMLIRNVDGTVVISQ